MNVIRIVGRVVDPPHRCEVAGTAGYEFRMVVDGEPWLGLVVQAVAELADRCVVLSVGDRIAVKASVRSAGWVIRDGFIPDARRVDAIEIAPATAHDGGGFNRLEDV